MQGGWWHPARFAPGFRATARAVVIGAIAAGVIIGALVFGSVNPAAAADPAAGPAAASNFSEPLWRQGISTWQGDHYELPERPAGSAAAAAAPSAYQIRSEPEANSAGATSAPAAATPSTGGSIPLTAPGNAVPPQHRPAPPPSSSYGPPAGTWPSPAPTEKIPAAPAPATSPAPAALPAPAGPHGAALDGGEASLPIGEQIESGEPADQPPLEEEIVQWYQYPWLWVSKGWDNHAEFGLDGSSGNSDTLAIQTGLEMKRKTDAYTVAIDLDYRQASNRDGTTEDNGRFNFDYDRLLGDSRWSWFQKVGLEWDRFKAFDLRLNANSGLGYHWVRTERSSLVTRLGAGSSKEFGSPDDAWVPEAVFGIEAEHQLTDRHKLLGKVEYFPAWENFSDYRIVTDLGWEMLLDDSESLSLKLALTDRYDSTPQGAEANDVYYSLLLLYKF